MADSDQITQTQTQTQVKEKPEQNLKYLKFVQVAALHMVIYISKLYDYAKDNSGPLKPGVQTVEGTVKAVVVPVYEKFHDVPVGLLKFVDRKVDESVNKLESHVHQLLKHVLSQALSAALKASAAAWSVAAEVMNAGVIAIASWLAKTIYIKYDTIAKGLYSKYEPVAEQYAVTAWHSLNNLPLFPQVAHAVLPTAYYISERYNETVIEYAKKGFKVALYLPLAPTGKIAKVFSIPANQTVAAANTAAVSNDGGVAAK